jgi:hypothetical protein
VRRQKRHRYRTVHPPHLNGRSAASRVLQKPWREFFAGVSTVPVGTPKRAIWRAARSKQPFWLAAGGLNLEFWALRSIDSYFFETPAKCLPHSPTAILLTSECSSRCRETYEACLESPCLDKQA